jgi:hypothetical protein
MRQLLHKFLRDQRASVLLTDWVFLATILVIVVVPTAVAVRNHVSRALAQSAERLTSR